MNGKCAEKDDRELQDFISDVTIKKKMKEESKKCRGRVITDVELMSFSSPRLLGTKQPDKTRCLVITALNLDLNVKYLPIDPHRLSYICI